MIITNEPGYYKEGSYGIRIENIMTVDKSKTLEGYLKFRSLTLVPYCNNLIIKDMLEKNHIDSIKRYYRRIDRDITPILLENQ
jgi:Xaa-Pro aminopeptidase